MTDDNTTRDDSDPSIDSESAHEPDSDGSTPASLDRRDFLQGTAASLASLGGATALSGRGSATRGTQRLLVVARGEGRHTYRIEMHDGGSIWKSDYAGSNDSTDRSSLPMHAEGTVWNWNVDSYEYIDRIHRIVGDGSLSFHFLDGGFDRMDKIAVGGEGQGTSHYSIGTANGDIDPVPETTNPSQDHDELSSNSERSDTLDLVEGQLWNTGVDTYTFDFSEQLQYIHIDDGHVSVSPYDRHRRLNSGSSGEASIVLFYMGDGTFTTFFQNFTNLSEALKGYDKTVLLKHDNQSSGVSAKAHNMADTVHKPTRDNFEQAIRKLAIDGYTIDLYIMSHGTRSAFKMSTGSFGSADYYDIGDIQRLRSEFLGQIPLRMVYQCNCWGSELNDAWLELGADAAAGARYVNFFPNQLPNFARQWRQGHQLHRALQRANTATSRQAVKQYLKGDMYATQGNKWDTGGFSSCTHIGVFNNNGSCAKDYFTNRWNHSDSEWHSVSHDGWGFVKYASEKVGGGDLTVSR